MNGRVNTDLPRKVRSFLEDGLFLLIIKGTLREEEARIVEVALIEEREKTRNRAPSKEVEKIGGNINGGDFI